MSMDYHRIGREIRLLREAKGESLRGVATRAGVSYSMIGMIEQGKAGDLKIGTLEKVLTALGGSLTVGVVGPDSPQAVNLPAGVEDQALRILSLLPEAEPEDVDVVLRWLERSAASRGRAAS